MIDFNTTGVLRLRAVLSERGLRGALGNRGITFKPFSPTPRVEEAEKRTATLMSPLAVETAGLAAGKAVA